jgi:F0F1-type ATP synthase alpha subunit
MHPPATTSLQTGIRTISAWPCSGRGARARFWVLLTHRQTGRTARINATLANALDVFHHPFAYERQAA